MCVNRAPHGYRTISRHPVFLPARTDEKEATLGFMTKIVAIGPYRQNQENDEAKLTKLVNDGWVIVNAGGGEERGFVILQKERGES
jgi:hypothetical protein